MLGEPRLVPGTSARGERIGGVACTVVEPENATRTVLYLHGGGYRLGSPAGWITFASGLAASAAARMVIVDYRLAPEDPFPAALHDAASVYDALLDAGTPAGAVVIAGDSAGGGLAAALTLACVPSSRPLPAGVLLISPWVDLSVDASTYSSRAATDQLFSEESAREAADSYLQGFDARDPLASPRFGDVTGFPPTLVFGGGAEVLLDDALRFTARLADAGTSVELHVVAGMQHVWPTIFHDLDESVAAIEAMARFLQRVS